MTSQHTALVLFSGGQDSSICLAYALSRYAHVETVGFDYGQRHHVELECRTSLRDAMTGLNPKWGERLGSDFLLNAPALAEIGGSALTDGGAIKLQDSGLPTSFVPGRNLIFFTYAAALAYRRGHSVLVGGMCETDFSGYPDCREATLQALMTAINMGMDSDLLMETPLMHLSKAQSWQLAHELGGAEFVEVIIEHSHSCYEGVRETRYEWGYGCNACPACDLRAKGFREWRIA